MSIFRNILIFLFLSLVFPFSASKILNAQEQTLTFTSISDAKFFVYLNGTLQNEKSSGMVTLHNLEEKEYHVRIVIDDPFEVAVTRRIKPDSKHNEYTVLFNAVRERVYLKPVKAKDNETVWQPDTSSAQPTQHIDNKEEKQRTSLRKGTITDTASQRMVNTIHQIQVLDNSSKR